MDCHFISPPVTRSSVSSLPNTEATLNTTVQVFNRDVQKAGSDNASAILTDPDTDTEAGDGKAGLPQFRGLSSFNAIEAGSHSKPANQASLEISAKARGGAKVCSAKIATDPVILLNAGRESNPINVEQPELASFTNKKALFESKIKQQTEKAALLPRTERPKKFQLGTRESERSYQYQTTKVNEGEPHKQSRSVKDAGYRSSCVFHVSEYQTGNVRKENSWMSDPTQARPRNEAGWSLELTKIMEGFGFEIDDKK